MSESLHDWLLLWGPQKDAMRLEALPRMVDTWYNILMRYHQSVPSLAEMCLLVIRRFVGTASGHAALSN